MSKLFTAFSLAAVALLGSAPADAAITVNFSITGGPSEPGSVMGHLTFGSAGTNVAATGVYIDSATADVVPPVSGYQGINFLTGVNTYENSFTVTDAGKVTSAALFISNGTPYANVSRTFIQLNDAGYNSFEEDFSSYYQGVYFRAITNTGGFAGTTYAAPAAAVPEPGAWTMIILGFGLAGAALRRRTTVRVAYAA